MKRPNPQDSKERYKALEKKFQEQNQAMGELFVENELLKELLKRLTAREREWTERVCNWTGSKPS